VTYSLAIKGVSAQNLLASSTQQLTLSDANAQAGAQLNAMQNGTAFLCQGPDGAQHYYALDPARSTPALPVLIYVGP
jgi:hypothetical protein